MNIEKLGLSELTKEEALEVNGGQVTAESSFAQDVGTVVGAVTGFISNVIVLALFRPMHVNLVSS